MFKLVVSLSETEKVSVIVRPSTKKLDIRIDNDIKKIDKILNSMGLEKVDLIDILPKFIKASKEMGNQECSICFEKYKSTEYVRTLNCNHSFHKKCVDKWLKKTPSCPNCRNDLIA